MVILQLFFLKSWLSLFFRITLQQHVVQESEPGSSEHVQMLARAQVLDGHKSWESKSCISSQPRRLAALFTRLVWTDVKEGLFHTVGRRDVVLYYVFRQTVFLRWKINCIFRLSLCSAPFLSPFFKKKSQTLYTYLLPAGFIFFFLYTSTWRIFFCVAIVKLWNMNKGVQYDMSCYMIFAMLPRDIPGVCIHTLCSSLLRCVACA